MSVAPDTVSLEEYQTACGIANEWAKRALGAERALRELVDLKDGTRDGEYERRKLAAWQRARDLLERAR